MHKDLYTITQLAALLGISKVTVQRMLKRGELPIVIVGKRKYFPRAKILELFQLESE